MQQQQHNWKLMSTDYASWSCRLKAVSENYIFQYEKKKHNFLMSSQFVIEFCTNYNKPAAAADIVQRVLNIFCNNKRKKL